ncbi:MMPL/RND family transporter [Lactobacillus corticis]|uniref:Membrane protein n=1 Tax=Lactobacillus corticis TaxID=2201249 RepID=A0A916QG97_9LACO|nr:MMPL family transporter [Lactobacillus corticis]GFZ26765.1 membrane protein [Lactobacillus corticis]
MQKFLKNHVFSLLAWIVILVISVVALPNVSALTRAHSTISLPSSVQSEVANHLEARWTKTKKNTHEIGIVFNKEHGKLTAADKEAIDNTVAELKANKSKYGIKSMQAPNDNAASKKLLKSDDGTTWLVQLNVSKNHGTIEHINKQLSKAAKTSGVRTYVTGADILTDDFSSSIQEGIKKTELITVVFIFIVLVIVFRSPIVPLISLLTVGVSFLVSFSIVTNLVQTANFPFSNFTQVFMIIVLFGIGTDYNILLYDKFKENLGKGMTVKEAERNALRVAGKTILYSGSSILIGFSALGLAKFSIYQSATGVAVGVAVLLIVLLTLNPFFMAVLGRKMFWPVKEFSGETESKLWHGIARGSLKHAFLALVLTAVIAVPFTMMYQNKLNYDDAAEISDSTPSKKGLLLIQKHFSKGMAEPTYIYIQSKHKMDNETYMKLLDELIGKYSKLQNVDFAAGVTRPYGEKINQLYVNNQMKTVNSGVNQVVSGLDKLEAGSNKITAGAVRLKTGAQTLSSGSSQLESGSEELASGTDRLASGSSRLYSGAGSLRAGTYTLYAGLNSLSQQLSAQLSSSSQSQIQQLQAALPKINSGIQELNSALGSNSSVDVSQLTTNLSNVASQAQTIGTQLSAAGNTLETLKSSLSSAGSTSLSDSDKAAMLAEYNAAAKKAGLNDAQIAAMDAALNSVLSSVESKVTSQTASLTSSLTSSLQSIGQNIEAAGDADKSLGTSLKGISGQASTLSGLLSQVKTLKSSVQELASASNVALPGAVTALNKLDSGLEQVQSAAKEGASGAGQLYTGANSLYSGLGSLNSGIGSLQSGESQLTSGAKQLTSGSDKLSSGAGKLASGNKKITKGLGTASTGLKQGGSYLKGLQKSAAAETFYIPKSALKDKQIKQSIKTYLSPDKKSAYIMVVFKSDPSGNKATNQAQNLTQIAKKSFKGTKLANAQVAAGGQSSHIQDTRQTASGDFTRTAAIMIIGIGIALMFVTRSLLQPIYIMLTLLIAYISSLSINQWLVKPMLGHDKLAWNVPFFSFIMIIALGVDYSIFLMTRYRELQKADPQASPSSTILHAAGIIGTVVISAIIILGGTFAALIPSGIPTLIEVATTVIIGLLILMFLLPITLPALVKLTYEGLNFDFWRKSKPKHSAETA